MSRVDSCRIAVDKAGREGMQVEGASAASDAFFPFPDGDRGARIGGSEGDYPAGRLGAGRRGHSGGGQARHQYGNDRCPAFQTLGRFRVKHGQWKGESIVILDFGSQYTQLIARRIREERVFSVILPPKATLEEIRAEKPWGIILSGGPASVTDAGAPQIDAEILSIGVPVLGICYGLHLITRTCGGEVEKADHREYGHTVIRIDRESALFHETPREQRVWMSHGDRVKRLPERFRRRRDLAGSDPRGHSRTPARHLRAAVPSRGVSHRVRLRDSEEFPLSRLRMRAELGIGLVRRARDREDPARRWATRAFSARFRGESTAPSWRASSTGRSGASSSPCSSTTGFSGCMRRKR